MSKIILSIIVVSYNTAELTVQALKSVLDDLRRSQVLNGQTEIFLVDNHSQDNSVAAVKKLFQKEKFKQFELILNQENFGFAKANNQALRKAKGDYLLLLNSDTIVQEHALETLVQTFQKYPDHDLTATIPGRKKILDQLALLSPTLLNPDLSIQPQGGSRLSLWAIFNQMFFLDDIPFLGKFLPSTQHTGLNDRAFVTPKQDKTSLIAKDWLAGTALMIKRELLDSVGFLDENIFMYGEDQEFCLRAQNHHFDLAIQTQAQIIHLGSASSSNQNALIGEFKAYLYIWQKHFPHWQMRPLKLILNAGALLRVLIYSLLGKNKQAKIYREILKTIN